MRTRLQYGSYKKPSWAPPAWLFGPVWTVLYIIIAASFGYVFYGFFGGRIPSVVALPFALNLVFNFLFTPIQFRYNNFPLALADVVLVWATLAWALLAAYPHAAWVAFANLPYLAWVSFATALQFTLTRMNAGAD